jgi:hypothetical protein
MPSDDKPLISNCVNTVRRHAFLGGAAFVQHSQHVALRHAVRQQRAQSHPTRFVLGPELGENSGPGILCHGLKSRAAPMVPMSCSSTTFCRIAIKSFGMRQSPRGLPQLPAGCVCVAGGVGATRVQRK